MNNQTKPKRSNGIRTLTYPLIKAGMRKAGPVPEPGSERVMLLAWLAAAGYGRACLPSLELYIRWRAIAGNRPRFGYRTRGKRREFTRESFITQGTLFGIKYPGEIQNPRKSTQVALAGSRSRYSPPDADDRREAVSTWKKWLGFYVAAALKAYGGKPSVSEVVSMTDRQTVLRMYTGRIWRTVVLDGIGRKLSYYETKDMANLNGYLHLGTRPRLLP